jgi:DNA polymerase-3 subunit delta
MAQLKAHEADTWLARHRSDYPVVLVYGPDRGLVSERAARFARGTAIVLDDPFAVSRMEGSEIDRDPGRLIDEARTVPMFGGRRLIWIRNSGGSKALADAVRLLCESPPPETIILLEAGDLKKGIALRSLVEGSASAIAIPCYVDDARGMDSVIDEVMKDAGLTIDSDARVLLRRLLGGDRLATRREVEKLALYAMGQDTVTATDVRMLSGDVSGRSLDEVVDAVLGGSLDDFDRGFARLAGGGQVQSIIGALQRQLESLHALRGRMEQQGTTAAEAVASARPPVFFARRRLVEQALGRWQRATIGRMLESLQSATLAIRRNPAISAAVAYRTLLQITRSAAARNRG